MRCNLICPYYKLKASFTSQSMVVKEALKHVQLNIKFALSLEKAQPSSIL